MLAVLLACSGCGGGAGSSEKTVVVYSAQDREFAEPVLTAYGERNGVEVLPKFDVESTKTVGLTQLLIQEAPRPRCDLFWNNEILNTLRLKEKGLLARWSPPNAADIPDEFKATDGTWYGFAARARILLVNTDLIPPEDRPRGLADLTDPKWKGKIAMAKPLFGTTATHFTCLFAAWGDEKARGFLKALKENEVQVLSGNKQVARAVASGQAAFGLTDTDDAMEEFEGGRPVAIVYPDREPDQLGTLFIPNVLAILEGAPHRLEAEALGNDLLGPEVEAELARGPSAQIPLNRKTQATARVETPQTVHAMSVDFEKAARIWDRVADELTTEFAGR
ncbi:extracellular solute-binding protein [Tundrisphaera lichenicola]|uniref:extracellular solute-binding protein n=1 Tax=Tundrisphaera lichenicola TaxID=2029860 RepID=UPI003EC0F4BA